MSQRKIIALTVCSIFILIGVAISLVINYRNVFVLRYANDYIASFASFSNDGYQSQLAKIQLTCIDLALPQWHKLTIKHACVEHPMASIEIKNLHIDGFALNDLANAVNTIQSIDSQFIEIKAKQAFTLPMGQPTNQSPALSATFIDAIDAIDAALLPLLDLQLPFPIHLKQILYYPYQQSNQPLAHDPTPNSTSKPYQIALSLAKHGVNASIRRNQPIASVALTSKPKPAQVNAQIAVDLTALRQLLSIHSVTLPGLDDHDLLIDGQVNLQVNWQPKQLTVASNLPALTLRSEKGFTFANGNSGAFNLNSQFNGVITLTPEQLAVRFSQPMTITAHIDQTAISDWLNLQLSSKPSSKPSSQPSQDPQSHYGTLLTFLQRHEVNGVELKLAEQLSYQFAPQHWQFGALSITSLDPKIAPRIDPKITLISGHHWPLQLAVDNLTVDNLTASPGLNSELDLAFNGQFDLQTTVNLAQLNTFGSQQQQLRAIGNVAFQHAQLTVDFAPQSGLKLDKLRYLLAQGDERPKAVPPQPEPAKPKPTDKTDKANKTRDPLRLSSGPVQLDWQGQLTLTKTPAQWLPKFNLSVNSHISDGTIKKWLKPNPLDFTATLIGEPTDLAVKGALAVSNLEPISIFYRHTNKQATLELKTAPLALLNIQPLLAVKLPFTLIDGTIDLSLAGKLAIDQPATDHDLTLGLRLKDFTGEVEKIWLQQLDYQQNFQLYNGKVSTNASENNFSLAQSTDDIPIKALKAQINLQQVQQGFIIKLDNLTGEAFAGRFAVASLQWPFDRVQHIDVTVKDLDIGLIVALQDQDWVQVTGAISGEMPLTIKGSQVTMSGGKLYNTSHGNIQILNNASLQQLKASSTELKLTFDALHNLNYHLLSADVEMSDAGRMKLSTKIQGINPDLDNEVNLNLGLDYDLLGLLQSWTYADHVKEQIQQKYQQ